MTDVKTKEHKCDHKCLQSCSDKIHYVRIIDRNMVLKLCDKALQEYENQKIETKVLPELEAA